MLESAVVGSYSVCVWNVSYMTSDMRNRCGNSHTWWHDDLQNRSFTYNSQIHTEGSGPQPGGLALCEKAGCNRHRSNTFLTASCYRHKPWHTLTDFNELWKNETNTILCGWNHSGEAPAQASDETCWGPGSSWEAVPINTKAEAISGPVFTEKQRDGPENFPLAVGFKSWMLIKSTQGKQALVFNLHARKVCYWMTGMLGKLFSHFLPFIHWKVLTFS